MLLSFLLIGFLVMLLMVVYLYFEHKNTKEKYFKVQKENERKLFELRLLTEISDKIGYSLSSKDIASTIASTAEQIFPVSAVSYAIITQDHLEITTVMHESLGPNYVKGIKEIMLAGIYTIDENIKRYSVSQKTEGIMVFENSDSNPVPLSYFNVPLVLNNRFTGMITITSSKAHAYQEEDMSMLYKIVNRAQLALSRLENVIEEEKGKVDSLVKSLSSGEMFFTIKYDSLQLYTINPAAIRFLGITQESAEIIQVLSKFKLKPNIIAEMKEVIQKRKSTIYRNVLVGKLRFNIYLTPVFTLKGNRVIGVALTMQDVTREHEAQKMREGFTNMMVHELRAPLTAIKGAADLLLRPTTEEEDRVKMRLIVKNASQRLLEDIDDMLDSAKIDAGKILVHKQNSSINEVIGKAVEELSYTAQDRSILIEKHLDDHIPQFAIDPVRIGQVMTNLISNSIKYSQPHTVISIFSRVKDEMVEVEVKDHGVGIEPDKIGNLFEPFSQGNFLQKVKGTGLGLYITKAIVSEHKGKIWVDSKKGEGTSVYFQIPLVEELPQEAKSSMAN